jgi:nitroreductase
MSGAGEAFFELVSAQRACRWFTADPVPDADVERLLTAATHAPSAKNTQPWVFVVVRDPAQRAAIDGIARANWEAYGRAHAEAHTSPGLFADTDAAVGAGHGGAPLLVVVAGDGRDGTPRSLLATSIFPAVQNLLLAANALGYGSQLTNLATFDPGLREVLGLPEGVEPMAVVPIGRPARPLGPPRRRPVSEKAHLDRFGTPLSGRPCTSEVQQRP